MNKILSSIGSFYHGLPSQAQFALDWVLRALIASIFFSFVSNVATFAYAVKYGARPPVEGVPYLSVTIGIFGFLLIIITVIAIYALPAFVAFLRGVSEWILDSLASLFQRPSKPTSTRTMFWWLNILSSMLAIFGLLASTETVARLLSWLGIARHAVESMFAWTAAIFSQWYIVVFAIVGTALLFALISSLSDRAWRYISNAIYALSILTVVIFSIHSPIQQASFEHVLRLSRFGGGMPVSIRMSDGTLIPNAYLFITSASMVTVYEPTPSLFRELNQDQIVEMRYGQSTGWRMPPQRDWRELWSSDQQQ